jgi:hypothetical protein
MAPRGKKAAGRTAAPATGRRKPAELPAQPRPDAPLDSQAFLRTAQPVLRLLEADLLERARASAAITLALARRHAAEREAGRTAATLDEWQRALVVQVAAAWLLSCVFVRTLEDRGAGAGAGLLGHGRIAGPGAMDSQRQFFDLAPSLTERDYLLTVFREMTRLPGVRDTFDARHNPVWKLAPSAQATRALLELFRAPDPEAPAFRFGQADTRFLGDLYQDLSEDVRKRFALLQTPAFVEAFILDRTLERAVHQFGVADTTVIDPTCGSGHFLLGAFDRLYNHRLRAQPGLDPREAAHLALDAIFGADINPYAVAIARFRLTLAFIDKGGYKRIKLVPRLPLHLVVADSLLHNPQHPQASFAHMTGQSARTWEGDEFALDDEQAARDVLHRRFTAVVGNPPYIQVKDKAQNERYRKMYTTAFRAYSLGVPFTERFFQLARSGGFIGMITANSFMKREFGKVLIEKYLPTVDLDLIINTAGAYIPGHGTPTVLLFGVNQQPTNHELLTVLARRGEPSTPENPEQGMVWQSIAGHWNDVGHEDDFISVTRMERASLAKHPWSLGGGGAGELKELLEERATQTLQDLVSDIGFGAVTREDDVFLLNQGVLERWGIPTTQRRVSVVGENLRDWAIQGANQSLWPYDPQTLQPVETTEVSHSLWPWRTQLSVRVAYGKTQAERGLPWCAYSMFFDKRARTPLTIAFAFVATHNHFALDRGGKVFNRTAPIIKLPEHATEDEHLALLAYLNSSTACFWMKQVFFDRGNRGEGGGMTAEEWEKFFEFDGTKIRGLPLPVMSEPQKREAAERARALLALGEERNTLSDVTSLFEDAPDAAALEASLQQREQRIQDIESRIRAMQEELDWWVYSLVGLAPPELVANADKLLAGARASDHLFARAVKNGEVGLRYFELCRLPAPESVASDAWAEAWNLAARVRAIAESPNLETLEIPRYKRTFREGFRPFDRVPAARQWLLDRSEAALSSIVGPQDLRPRSAREWLELLGDAQCCDSVASECLGAPWDTHTLQQLASDNAVPFLAVYRYTETGLEKHQAWQHTWTLQRDEDAGKKVDGIPVPPKYGSGDFRSPVYYRLRGKLDVPKERFISYPGCESEHDALPVYGWAGWNHLQRLQALALLYQDRKRSEGWPAERLVPMLAGMVELLPWVKQWHNDPDPAYDGLRLGDYFEGFVKGQCDELGISLDDVRAWRPAARTARRAAKASPRKRATASTPDDTDDSAQ